jgi:putative membrane protein
LIGAHYSYAHVPFCDWVKNSFGFSRNNFDKIGHFFQGFVTAVFIKEIIYRKKIINTVPWMNFFAIVFSIALSATYEIIEWFWAEALIYFNFRRSSTDFLGTQGYIWDTQSDMFFAAIGAIIAIFVFGKYHEKKIKQFLSITNLKI